MDNKELLEKTKEVLNGPVYDVEIYLITLLTYLHPLAQKFKDDLKVDILEDIHCFEYEEIFKNGTSRKCKVHGLISLIKYLRDAMLHPELKRRFCDINDISVNFGAINGRGVFANIGGMIVESKYSDDVAYFHGKAVLYQKRHIDKLVDRIEVAMSN